MKIAVLSDVHANWEALCAVLRDARRQGATDYVCLGDMIGFNGDPAPCLSALIPRLNACVLGNHEHALLHPGSFVPPYESMIRQTERLLSNTHLDYIRSLPLQTLYSPIALVHADYASPDRWRRLTTLSQAACSFRAAPSVWNFFGHTHRAGAFGLEGEEHVHFIPLRHDVNGSAQLRQQPGMRYLINPGSVGQPRDGDWRASYALLCPDNGLLEWRRVPYDVQTAAEKTMRTGLPPVFSQALFSGESPTGD